MSYFPHGTAEPPKRQKYYENVKQVVKGQQRLGIKVLAPRTEIERAMVKIPSTQQKTDGDEPHGISYKDIFKGGFAQFNNVLSANRITQKSITDAKLPRPVDISKKILIQDQVAINLNDKGITQLSDLSFSDQKDVLGSSDLLEQEEPPTLSLIDVPADGYDFKKIIRKDDLSRQDILQEFDITRGRGFKTKVSSKPFKLPEDNKSYNYVELVRKANANSLFQDNIFNTNY